jgi:hypothetical protein
VETLAEFLIRSVELIEAEARSLRAGFFRLGVGLVALLVAGALLVSGVGLLGWASYLRLTPSMSPAGAAGLVGGALLLLSGGLLWATAKRIVN